MKVGFVGASGSGKSTTAEAIFKRYNVGLIKEVARIVFEEFSEKYGFRDLVELRNSDKYINFQKRILCEQIGLEREAVREFDVVLCDRTVYDIYMYAYLYSKPRDFESFLSYYNYRMKTFEEYDKIFFFEYLKGVDVDDGFRTPDVKYRDTQEIILKKILENLGINYTYIPQKPLEVRIGEVVKHIV